MYVAAEHSAIIAMLVLSCLAAGFHDQTTVKVVTRYLKITKGNKTRRLSLLYYKLLFLWSWLLLLLNIYMYLFTNKLLFNGVFAFRHCFNH